MAVKILLLIVITLTIILPIGSYFVIGKKGKRSFKRTLLINLTTFAAAIIISSLICFTGTASAAEEASTVSGAGLGYIGAALAVGISCLGSGIAVANSASAALGALSENDSLFGKSLVFVGLSEGIALYGLIIAFMILGSI